MTSIMDAVSGVVGEFAKPALANAGDWRDEEGTLICGVCGEQKETTIELFGRKETVRCLCKCERDAEQLKQLQWEESQRRMKAERLRDEGIADTSLKSCRFEDADMTPQMERCKFYADHFEEFRAANVGMVFCGQVGNGKTYAAACIANELIDRGIPVLITSLPRILNASKSGLNEVIHDIQRYDLVVIDDFGTERQTEYAVETATYFLDERYKSGRPTIITTNLSKSDLEHPQSKEYERIFSRITEMCQVMGFPKVDRRTEKAAVKKQMVQELVKKLQVNGDDNA